MQRPDGAKNVDYWRQKLMGLRAEVTSLDEENTKLRVLLSMREHPEEPLKTLFETQIVC